MMLEMCKAKIHRLTVTETNVNYEGSITLDKILIDAAGLIAGEKVQIVNINNGARFDTYILCGSSESGIVCLNGAAARLAVAGDIIIVISYGLFDKNEAANFIPRIVFVDSKNKIQKKGAS